MSVKGSPRIVIRVSPVVGPDSGLIEKISTFSLSAGYSSSSWALRSAFSGENGFLPGRTAIFFEASSVDF